MDKLHFFPSLLPIPRDARDSARICFKLYPFYFSLSFPLPFTPLAPFCQAISSNCRKNDLPASTISRRIFSLNPEVKRVGIGILIIVRFLPIPPFPPPLISLFCERDKEFCRILRFLSVVNLNALD